MKREKKRQIIHHCLKHGHIIMMITLFFWVHVIFEIEALSAKVEKNAKENPRYLSLNIWGWDTGAILTNFKSIVDDAKKKGFNTISLAFPWSYIEPSQGRFHYEWLDERVDYIVKQELFVVLRVSYSIYPSWLDNEYLMKQENGSVFKGPWEKGIISIADNQARAWMERVLVKTVKRYQNRYASKPIVYYSIPFAPAGESEYWTDRYLDYSQKTKADFRLWLETRYGAVNKLNARWNTSYSTFSKISLPKLKKHGSSAWSDWVNYRTFALKRLFDQLADAVHSLNLNAKLGVQFGSIWDGSSGARGTYDAARLIENVDWIIVDDAPWYNHKFSMDLLRTIARGKRIGNEIGEPLAQLMRKDLVPEDNVLTHGLETFAYGGDMLHFANWERTFKFPISSTSRSSRYSKIFKDFGYIEGIIHINQPSWESVLSKIALEAKKPVSNIEEPKAALYVSTMAQYLYSYFRLPGYYRGVNRGVDTYEMIKETYQLLTDAETIPIAIVTDSLIIDDPSSLNRYTKGIYIPSFNKIISDKAYASFQRVRVPLIAEDKSVGTKNEYGDTRHVKIFQKFYTE